MHTSQGKGFLQITVLSPKRSSHWLPLVTFLLCDVKQGIGRKSMPFGLCYKGHHIPFALRKEVWTYSSNKLHPPVREGILYVLHRLYLNCHVCFRYNQQYNSHKTECQTWSIFFFHYMTQSGENMKMGCNHVITPTQSIWKERGFFSKAVNVP